ncbi:MAG TPA: class I tRNA ligase family protein, partial [Firmicutes bacterium]|nr:class I tRNA ligase family protein [Bacillota bacterium]
ANKIWNASRYVLMNLGEYPAGKSLHDYRLELADRWILHRFNETAAEVTRQLEKYELGEAARIIYDFLWNDFCDWYIELSKGPLYGEDAGDREKAQLVLCHVLGGTLTLLHPFMPFLTEEIWSKLPLSDTPLIVSSWPEPGEELNDPAAMAKMNLVMEAVRSIRNLRSEMKIPPQKKINVVVRSFEPESEAALAEGADYLKRLSGVDKLVLGGKETAKPSFSLTTVLQGGEAHMLLEGLVDPAQEITRLQKELAIIEAEVFRCEKKLSNEGFLKKAPAELVAEEKEKLDGYMKKRNRLAAYLKELDA